MKERFANYKLMIDNFLDEFLEEKRNEATSINVWGNGLIDKIKEFSKRGKTLRGGFILASYEIFSGKVDKDAIKTATAIELLHSALLIHDDILDKDELRRGKKTVYAQYEDFGKGENFEDAKHFGYGMAICAGDICISGVFELLGSLECKEEIKKKVINLFCAGLNCVGLAEMEDFYMGYTKKQITEERILNMYNGKTARYTFSVPLIAGATLAGQSKDVLDSLEELAKRIGIIFQIRDDELGLFGEELELGKPIGSDISEDKKTLFRLYLFEKATEEEIEKLKGIFGNSKINEEMIEEVRKLMIKYKIKEKIGEKIEVLDKEAREIVVSLKIGEKDRKFLDDFMNYNLNRVK